MTGRQEYPCRFLTRDHLCKLRRVSSEFCTDPLNARAWCSEYWPVIEGVI